MIKQIVNNVKQIVTFRIKTLLKRQSIIDLINSHLGNFQNIYVTYEGLQSGLKILIL